MRPREQWVSPSLDYGFENARKSEAFLFRKRMHKQTDEKVHCVRNLARSCTNMWYGFRSNWENISQL